MDLYIGTYREMSEKDQIEIQGLIIKGNEANASLVENRLYSSALTAYFKDGDSIMATTSIKIPETYYINEVFSKALTYLNPSKYIPKNIAKEEEEVVSKDEETPEDNV